MKRCLFLACLVLMLFLGSALAYEYTPDVDVSFYEPFEDQPFNTQPGYSYASDRALYLFSGDVEEQTREQFIDRQEKLMKQLDVSGLTICAMPDYETWVISGARQMFLCPLDETGMIQAIATLQSIYGEYANYGLIFGYADRLCKEAGLPGHEARYNDKGMLRFYNNKSNLSAFLLLYPSFTTLFENESNQPLIQDMAVRFCAFLAEKDLLLPLLQEQDPDAFNQRYIALMNEFLQAAGAETQLYTHLPAIRFGSAGEKYSLVISTAHGEWFIEKDYYDPSDYWINWDFDTLFNTVWKVEDDLVKADQTLSLPLVKRQFLFAKTDASAPVSLYAHHEGEGPICPSGIEDLMHEYIHACTQGWYTGENAWFLTELAATYFEIQGQKNPQSGLVYTLWYDLSDEQAEYWGPVLDAMKKRDPLSYYPEPEEIYHYLCFVQEQYDLFTPSSRTLNTIRSFAYYLEEYYGNEKMGRILQEGTPENVLGKDWTALQQDWQQHLTTSYGNADDQAI